MGDGLYPLVFEPVYKDYMWGGDRLAHLYGRANTPPVCAESWEISSRPEGMSIVRNRPLAGSGLGELTARLQVRLTGKTRGSMAVGEFPLLIKIIDARQRLSVQVHPDDEGAARWGGEAKTEMWYVLDAVPGSRIYAGLKPGVTRKSLEAAARGGRLDPLLHTETAVPGQAVYVPGGQVHAIGEGCLLLEVQQNSNTTYRLHDWGRVDSDGKPRELHLKQALRVINWALPPPHGCAPNLQTRQDAWTDTDVLTSPYFAVHRLDLEGTVDTVNNGSSFHALFVEAGEVEASGGGMTERLAAGASCLMPAGLAAYSLRPLTHKARLIRTALH